MAVATNWGPPSIAGSINEGVDSILGGIKDYQTGQMLQNLPRTADGSVDYRAAAAAMYRTNPGLAAQFLKMEELKGLQDYRKQSLGIQQQHVDIAKDKTQNLVFEDKIIHIGRDGVVAGVTDANTGQRISGGGAAQAPAASQPPGPRTPPQAAIDLLKQQPDKAALFEKHYGLPPGSAQQYLGGGAPAPAAPAPTTPAAPTTAPTVPAPVAAPAPPAAAAPQQPRREPGEGYSAWKAREKKFAEERGTIDNAALKKTDDAIEAGINTVKDLGRLLQLNSKSMSGWPAVAAPLAAQFGNEKASNTIIMDNMLKAGALAQLKDTFGAQPSNKEGQILQQIQGAVTAPAAVRQEIWTRALEAARRRVKYNQKYANAVRAGNQQLFPAYTDNLDVDNL